MPSSKGVSAIQYIHVIYQAPAAHTYTQVHLLLHPLLTRTKDNSVPHHDIVWTWGTYQRQGQSFVEGFSSMHLSLMGSYWSPIYLTHRLYNSCIVNKTALSKGCMTLPGGSLWRRLKSRIRRRRVGVDIFGTWKEREKMRIVSVSPANYYMAVGCRVATTATFLFIWSHIE